MNKVKVFVAVLLLVEQGWSQTCPTQLDADVIIIGAGMAGAAAANRLNELDVKNVLILEGSSKVGGRVASEAFAGVRVSLGAAWVQGLDSTAPSLHPIYKLASECPSLQGLRGIYTDDDDVIIYNAEGSLSQAELRYDAYEAAIESIESPRSECVSLRNALNESGWSPVTAADNWIEWFCNDYCDGENPDVVSVVNEEGATFTSFVAANDSEGGDYFVTDNNGIDKIVECLANKTLENEQARLLLSTVITSVDLSNADCVCVMTDNNGTAGQYCGRYAISTVSTGVLQAEQQLQFTPELPAWKREVIDRFDSGRYVNIFLEFNEVFWDSNEHIGHIATERARYPLFINLNQVFPERPKVLIAVLTGDHVTRVHSQPDRQTIAEIELILSRIYPSANTTVIDYIIPNWISNPLTRGAFTVLPVDFKREYFELLAAPVGNLYFSGEATSMDFNGYIHGAYFAGEASADQVAGRLNSAMATKSSCLLTLLLVAMLIMY